MPNMNDVGYVHISTADDGTQLVRVGMHAGAGKLDSVTAEYKGGNWNLEIDPNIAWVGGSGNRMSRDVVFVSADRDGTMRIVGQDGITSLGDS